VGVIAEIPAPSIKKALTKFRGIEHRLEFVASIMGVDYFNDSKATNPDALVKALGSFDSPIVLMAGGRNKGNSFQNLALEIKRKAKAVVLFGEAASEMYPLIKDFDLRVVKVKTVPEAVKEAKNLSQCGDIVLFSPACASFDQFSNYEERGHVFKGAVINLKKK
jgi:UDP-N-acetylmuramoylalanine--D-glutamate ligase